MHLRSLTLEGFTRHKHTELVFPERGIVLVTGRNGSGKSSLPEAVSVAVWNQPLRKKTGRKNLKLFRSKKGYVKVETDLAWARRSASGKLTWAEADALQNTQYENNTKAQHALEQRVGSHLLWSRCNVFSSSDVAAFSKAKDSDRKQLLESALRLDVFDKAHETCRKDLREAQSAEQALRARQAVLQERVNGLRAQIKASPVAASMRHLRIAGKPVVASTYEKACIIQRKILARNNATRVVAPQLRRESELLVSAVAKCRALTQQAEAAHEMALSGSCSKCGLPLPERATKSAARKLKEAKEAEHTAREALADARLAVQAAEEAAQRAQEEAGAAREALGQLKAWYDVLEGAKRERWRLKRALRDALEELFTVELELAEKGSLAAELGASAQALSLTGVRATMLAGALGGIEAVANAWLARLSTFEDNQISCTLKPYAESGGSVKDAISLELHGLPMFEGQEGQDFGAVSGGERRRVDIALVLALSEVEAGASGGRAGTLFFDEVFDWLDEEGREAVSEILVELAETTCVVVITHNKELISGLAKKAAAVWNVERGIVHERRARVGKATAREQGLD